MKNNLKKMISLCLVLVLALAAVPCASAARTNDFLVESYTVKKDENAVTSVSRDDMVSVDITLWSTNSARSNITVVRGVDSFQGGVVPTGSIEKEGGKFKFPITGLTYKGEGKTLRFTVNEGGDFQTLTITVTQCIESGSEPTEEPTDFTVSDYSVSSVGGSNTIRTIEKNNEVRIQVKLQYKGTETISPSVVHKVDSFHAATSSYTCTESSGIYMVDFSKLTYTGTGNSLSFTVSYNGKHQTITIPIAECVPYEKPSDDWGSGVTEPTSAPRAVITYSGLPELLSSGETATVKLDIKNTGRTAMKAPILSFAVSDSLLITDSKYTVSLADIGAGKTVSVSVPIKAFGKITAQKQSIDASMSFDYYNNVSTVSSEASAHIIVPCKLTDGSVQDPTAGGNPVPIVILSGYSYGASAIAAGSEANLQFTFTNTSKLLDVENIVLKITTGSDLRLNGSSNTLYFEKLAAGGSKTVTLPLKASQIIAGSTQDVGLSFSYEYVDNDQRLSRSSDMSISVPLYQPDRFELSEPVAAYVGYVGEETSLTMDYVNKGKSEVCNVEARISGDVDSYNSFVRVGNIASGKNGTIAFAVTPMLEGDNKAIITVSYEDVNGEVKERIFETTLSAMAMEPFDPGEWEDPLEPVDEGNGFPWWIVGIVLAVATIVIGIVVSRKKKKAKLAKEQALWDDWDEEANTEKKAEALPETAGVGAEGTDK